MPHLEFTCPKCGKHEIEEIMADVVVASVINIDLDNDDVHYGEQTNEDGHVDRYACKCCGYVVCDDNSEDESGQSFSEMGLDHYALAKAIRALNAEHLAKGLLTKPENGDPVDRNHLRREIANANGAMADPELSELWNSMFPKNQVVYDGDSLFWVKT